MNNWQQECVGTSPNTSLNKEVTLNASLVSQPLPSMLLLLRNHAGKGLVRLDRFSCHMQERVQANQIAGQSVCGHNSSNAEGRGWLARLAKRSDS